MKVAHFIFAVYILLLSVYPCSDNDTCADEQKIGITQIDTGSHHHTNSEQDLCTPFCICACCAAHIKLTFLANTDLAGVIHNTKVITPYIEKQALSNNNHIWQPPRA